MAAFRGFFKKAKSKKKSKISSSHEERIKNILGIRELEAMPAHAARAFQIASDPKANSASFVKIIESDEALSARILRIANSVYFSRGTPANDIEKSVANIGLDELRCLLSATMLKHLLQGRAKSREQVWSNAVATATFCRGLAGYCRNINSSEAFLCGLVHDIGKLVMVRRADSLYSKVVNRVSTGELDFVEAEEEIFELNHVDVGQWVAERWRFPEKVIEAISNHHRAWPKTPAALVESQTLSLLVSVADLFSHAAGIGHPATYRGFQKACQERLPEACELLGVAPDEHEAIIERYRREFDKNFGLYGES